MRSLLSLSFALPAALIVAACASTAVEPPPEERAAVHVTPVLSSIDGGATVRLTLTVRQADGTVLHPAGATWKSSDLAIATVGEEGLVRGGAPGLAQITAHYQGVSGTALVKVLPVIRNKNEPQCQGALRIPSGPGKPGDQTCRI